MSDFILTRQRIRSGRYEGILTSRGRVSAEPELEMQFLGTSVGNVDFKPDEKTKRTWNIKAQIPLFSINEGVQTYVIRDAASEETLDSFAIVCGEPLQEDLRTEMALLRAELEMLKKSFWKHVVKTGE